ncbi:unnamed protein product [Echinostoma caproni]|uniref:Transposase n=1 Tax=Echinostoma caproni TaxID=27848 RepID=A0A183AU54_9TREM|nr:unnamed protein product [Echinostoma caproni]
MIRTRPEYYLDAQAKAVFKKEFKRAVSAVAYVEHGELSVPKRPSYSTYTSNEPRQWWLASLDCRHADMARLLGLNPKLVDWHVRR